MKFKQSVSGKKLVILAIMLVLLSGFGLGAYSKDPKWNLNNIPKKWRFELKVTNPNSSKGTVDIEGHFFTKSVSAMGFGTNWKNLSEDVKAIYQKVIKGYRSGPDTLYLEIEQKSNKPFPFGLKKFALTQGKVQYGWDSHFNIKPLTPTLKIATYWGANRYRVHSLRPGVKAFGLIYLPDKIYLSKPFTIWYGEYSAELHAEGLDIKEQSN